MSLTTYRTILFILYGAGFVTAAAYLYLYRAWELRRWRTAAARDNSGLIAILWAVYGWLIYRLIDAILDGRGGVPPSPSLWIGLLTFAAIDGGFLQRLLRYWRFLAEERRHPTVPCPRCDGAGVILARVD